MRPLAWRKAAGLTQEEVAYRLGLTGATVSRHEQGLQHPRVPDQLRYQSLTNGKVGPDDWVDLFNDPVSQASRALRDAKVPA